MKYYIIRVNYVVLVGYYCFIYVGYIFEGFVVELDDIGMVKVCVRCKEYFVFIKFIIYNFVYLCVLLCG